MKKSATQFALYLHRHPKAGLEQWQLMRALPNGMSDLLQTASSTKKRAEVADFLGVDEPELKQALVNFLLLVLAEHEKSPYRGLATREQVSLDTCTRHKKLLQNVFHPDKFQDERSHGLIQQIQRSYDQILQMHSHQNGDIDVAQVHQDHYRQNNHEAEPVISFQVNDAPRRSSAYRKHQQKKQTNIVLMAGIAGLALASLLVVLLVPSSPNEMVRQSVIAAPTPQIAQDTQKIILAGSVNTVSTNSNANTRYQSLESLDNAKVQALLNEFERGLEADLVNDLLESKQPSQSSRQIMNLFVSADQKKVFLHGFSWNPVRNGFYGEGEFLARFQFTGNNQWVTRKGKSTITLSDNGSQLLIEQFHFEDNLH